MSTYKIIQFFLTIFLFFTTTISAGGIQDKSVTSIGYGTNENLAIKDALIQALSQVKGTEISSEKLLEAQTFIKNDDETYYEKTKEKIEAKTKGIIKSYKIISINIDNESRLFKAKLKSKISNYSKGPQLERLRLGVLPFRINNNIYNNQSIQFIQAWQKDLEEGLTQTRRFAMIDKSYEYESGQELNKYKGKEYDIEEMARLGNKAGIDYMIVGTLESLNDKTVNVSDKSIPIREVAISLRIIDVATSQIKYAKTVANAKKAVRDILYAIYPIRVVAVNSKTVTLGSGGDYLKKGTHFQVVKLGKPLIDPYTKEKLGREEIDIGEVVLTEINAKTSKAEIVKGEAEIQSNANNDLMLRPVSAKTKKNLVDELDDMNY